MRGWVSCGTMANARHVALDVLRFSIASKFEWATVRPARRRLFPNHYRTRSTCGYAHPKGPAHNLHRYRQLRARISSEGTYRFSYAG